MNITDHAYKRAVERIGWDKKTFDRMSVKIDRSRYRINDYNNMAKGYILSKNKMAEKAGRWVKLYKSFIFIMKGKTVITCYRIPNELAM